MVRLLGNQAQRLALFGQVGRGGQRIAPSAIAFGLLEFSDVPPDAAVCPMNSGTIKFKCDDCST
jgi:hypothetical protein